MKKIFILFLVILFTSCKSRSIVNVDKKNDSIEVDFNVKEISYSDTEHILLKSMVGSSDSKESTRVYDDLPKSSVKNNKSKSSNTNSYSIEKKNESVSVNYSEGLIAYSVPKEMKVGKTYPIKVRISKENNKTVLVIGDRKIPISDDDNSVVSVEKISVSSVMSANILVDKDKFKIVELSTEFQNIGDKGYTEWRWDITPTKSGNNSLKVNVKIRVKEDGKEYYRDIVVFDRRVGVKSNIGFSITIFITTYWQWLLTVIIIPILKWLYDKYSKKNKEDNK